MAGFFDRDGYVELRPALVLAPALAIEPYVGLACSTTRDASCTGSAVR